MMNSTRVNIPNYHNEQFCDKEGNLTANAQSFFKQLIVCLQYVLSTEGIRLPSKTQAMLANLTVPGALIYTSDTNKAWVNLNGVFREIAVV